MMGLLVLIVFAIYLLVSVFVVRKAVGWAKTSNRKPWLWGGLAAFFMYNLVFWDWIPTVIAHKYYCSTQAGLTVFKTPEQWKAENPDVTEEDLKPLGNDKEMLWDFPYEPLKNNPNKKVLMINRRIYLDNSYEKNILILIPIHKSTSFIADSSNNQRLAQLVTFGSGYGNYMTGGGLIALKFWAYQNTCQGPTNKGERSPDFVLFIKKIIQLGGLK